MLCCNSHLVTTFKIKQTCTATNISSNIFHYRIFVEKLNTSWYLLGSIKCNEQKWTIQHCTGKWGSFMYVYTTIQRFPTFLAKIVHRLKSSKYSRCYFSDLKWTSIVWKVRKTNRYLPASLCIRSWMLETSSFCAAIWSAAKPLSSNWSTKLCFARSSDHENDLVKLNMEDLIETWKENNHSKNCYLTFSKTV